MEQNTRFQQTSPNKFTPLKRYCDEYIMTFNISGFFQGPLSERRQPPRSAQVQLPPRNSGNSLQNWQKIMNFNRGKHIIK